MSNKQLSKRQYELSMRFQSAYEQLGESHRRMARAKFCQEHFLAEGTFNNKACGTNKVRETEAQWMERIAADPYTELKGYEQAAVVIRKPRTSHQSTPA